jgi:hypothetical protein
VDYNFPISVVEVKFMKFFNPLFVGVMLIATLGFSQSPTSTPAPAAHGAFPVKVTKALDSSKLKEGDSVEVETSGSFKLADGTLVSKGSKLTGRVVAAKARSKGDTDSQLNIAFDKLNIVNGKQLSVKGTVQAVFPPVEEQEPQMAGKATGAGGGGYGSSATVGTVTNSKVGSNTEAVSKPEPAYDPKSVGVQGVRDLDLNDGVLTSKGKNVKLGGGVRMIVRAEILS